MTRYAAVGCALGLMSLSSPWSRAGTDVQVVDADHKNAPVKSRVSLNEEDLGPTDDKGYLRMGWPCKAKDFLTAHPASSDYLPGKADCNIHGDPTRISVFSWNVAHMLEDELTHARDSKDVDAEARFANELAIRFGIEDAEKSKLLASEFVAVSHNDAAGRSAALYSLYARDEVTDRSDDPNLWAAPGGAGRRSGPHAAQPAEGHQHHQRQQTPNGVVAVERHAART
jgi:hypothetical protein